MNIENSSHFVATSTSDNPTFSISTIRVTGLNEALLGLSLSYNQPVDKMMNVAHKLAHKGNGHNKFLESICSWHDISAARDWWAQFDTYRIGVTKQSESTMHTITKQPLTQQNFAIKIKEEYLEYLNNLIEDKAPLSIIKKAMPEAFIQRRIVCSNYKTLQLIARQRHNHKLNEWHTFCNHLTLLPNPTLITSLQHNFSQNQG